jgi:acetolactate synthase-1/2/3 large subunit
MSNPTRHGGAVLADHLVTYGVRRVFSVPGESFLAALDGLHDTGIDNIVCRQEGGAAMMAEAYGKLTGTPGVCFVTRGPGATNASAGIHIAQQDSTPMVMFVGQIARDQTDREAFQEVDYTQMFGGLAKWTAQINQTERLGEYIARAFRVAMSGRPGPVVLALPEDMLSALVDHAPAAPISPPVRPAPDGQAILDLLADAERPLIVAGGPLWSQTAADNLAMFAATQNIPMTTGFRRQDLADNSHPCYAGDLNVAINPALALRVRDADTILLLGTRLGDIETQGYTLLDPAGHGKTLIHVHASDDELGRVYAPTLAVHTTAPLMLEQLATAPRVTGDIDDWTASARADYDMWITPKETPGDVKMEQVIAHLNDVLPEDAILTNGAGNYAGWLHRYYVWTKYSTQLAPTSGSMGYGFPAAISAALEHPDRPVICLAGDGCFQMTCNELSTAKQYGANLTVIVVNNGRYGTIRMHQEVNYPSRVSGTVLENPDFAALAKAYGGHGETVLDQSQLEGALSRAMAHNGPSVIELTVDPEALTTGRTLTQIREAAT